MTASQKPASAFPLAVLKWIWAWQGRKVSLREYEFLSQAVQSCLVRALEQPQEAPGCSIALFVISVLETELSALHILLEDDYCCQRWGSQCPLGVQKGCLVNVCTQCSDSSVCQSICLYRFKNIFVVIVGWLFYFFNTFFALNISWEKNGFLES